MAWQGIPTTLYRALKKKNGKVVVLDLEHLAQTTFVARTAEDYERAIRDGWVQGGPQAALDAFEKAEEEISNAAAEHAYKVLSMSQPAQQEVEAYEATTPLHVPELPEAPKRRGRPKKATG